MPITQCKHCYSDISWRWEDAFDKFGFNDGDGLVMTPFVVVALERAGYMARSRVWGLHNEIIVSVQRDGVEVIPPEARVGYDDPRRYLPEDLVVALDDAFPDEEVVR